MTLKHDERDDDCTLRTQFKRFIIVIFQLRSRHIAERTIKKNNVSLGKRVDNRHDCSSETHHPCTTFCSVYCRHE